MDGSVKSLSHQFITTEEYASCHYLINNSRFLKIHDKRLVQINTSEIGQRSPQIE